MNRFCEGFTIQRSSNCSIEYRRHGEAVQAERALAKQAGRSPDFVSLVRSWGGVTIAYRKRLADSPAYRLNHEEVAKALEEGIVFAENLNPLEAVPDERGAVEAMIFRREGRERREGQPPTPPGGSGEPRRSSPEPSASEGGAGDLVTLPARTVLVAAGTSPNITCEKEAPNTFRLDAKQKFFQPHRIVRDDEVDRFRLVPDPNGFFTSYVNRGRFATYYGDNHPRYAGNVVKAMASARDGFPRIVELFANDLKTLDSGQQTARDRAWRELVAALDDELIARVEDVIRLTPTIVEVIVKAPAAARHFHPGQFYRLQNYESVARRVGSAAAVPLLMEGIALTGAWVDKEKGLLSLIALELGVSSRLVAYLNKGEPVVVMGPTGAPTEIPDRKNVLLLGGGLGNAVLFSIAKAMRERGNRVIYFAGYKKGEDLFKREEIEAATDQVIWSTDTGAAISPPSAGCSLSREHRASDAGVPQRRARNAAGAARHRRSDYRHRFGSHDGRREGRAARRAQGLSEGRARRRGEHQLTDAVHDERSVRAVPAEARGSADGQGVHHFFLLQPGSGDGSRGLSEPGGALAPEHDAGEAVEPWLDHLLAGESIAHV